MTEPLWAKFLRHVRRPTELPRVIWKNLRYPFTPQAGEARFDAKHGVDTSGWIDLELLGLDQPQVGVNAKYGATPPRIAEYLIRQVAHRESRIHVC